MRLWDPSVSAYEARENALPADHNPHHYQHGKPSRCIVQAIVHQFGDDGIHEVLTVQVVQASADVEHLGAGETRGERAEVVHDAYIVFATPPPGGERYVPLVQAGAQETTRPSKRHKRDPSRPRGYISAFNYFVQDKRQAYVQNHPEAQVILPGTFEQYQACLNKWVYLSYLGYSDSKSHKLPSTHSSGCCLYLRVLSLSWQRPCRRQRNNSLRVYVCLRISVACNGVMNF